MLGHFGIIPLSDSLCVLCNSRVETSESSTSCYIVTSHGSYGVGGCDYGKFHGHFPTLSMTLFGNGNVGSMVISSKKCGMLPFSSSYGPCGRRGTLEFFDNSSSFLDELKDLVFLRLSWWIKGWNCKFPFSSSDILRESSCLIWKSQSIRPCKLNNMVSFSTWSPPPVGPLKWNVDASIIRPQSLSSCTGWRAHK